MGGPVIDRDPGKRNGQLAGFFPHRVDRVGDQIHQNRLNLRGVDEDRAGKGAGPLGGEPGGSDRDEMGEKEI